MSLGKRIKNKTKTFFFGGERGSSREKKRLGPFFSLERSEIRGMRSLRRERPSFEERADKE